MRLTSWSTSRGSSSWSLNEGLQHATWRAVCNERRTYCLVGSFAQRRYCMNPTGIGNLDGGYIPHGLTTRRARQEGDDLSTALTHLERALDGIHPGAAGDW